MDRSSGAGERIAAVVFVWAQAVGAGLGLLVDDLNLIEPIVARPIEIPLRRDHPQLDPSVLALQVVDLHWLRKMLR